MPVVGLVADIEYKMGHILTSNRNVVKGLNSVKCRIVRFLTRFENHFFIKINIHEKIRIKICESRLYYTNDSLSLV